MWFPFFPSHLHTQRLNEKSPIPHNSFFNNTNSKCRQKWKEKIKIIRLWRDHSLKSKLPLWELLPLRLCKERPLMWPDKLEPSLFSWKNFSLSTCFAGGGGIATWLETSPFCFGRGGGGGITTGGDRVSASGDGRMTTGGDRVSACRDCGSIESGLISGRLSLSPSKPKGGLSVSVSSSSGLAQAFPLRNLQGISHTEIKEFGKFSIILHYKSVRNWIPKAGKAPSD